MTDQRISRRGATISGNRQHGGLAQRIFRLVALGSILIAANPVMAGNRAMKPAFAVAQEAQIVQCIGRHSEGRNWLAHTLLALRNKEGGWIGAQVPNTNGTFDLGPMQVNDWWVPRIATLIHRDPASVRHWLTFDPCFNVGTARWIFLSALAQTKDYWRAIGIFHSRTRWRQIAYARDVAKLLTSAPQQAVTSPIYSVVP